VNEYIQKQMRTVQINTEVQAYKEVLGASNIVEVASDKVDAQRQSALCRYDNSKNDNCSTCPMFKKWGGNTSSNVLRCTDEGSMFIRFAQLAKGEAVTGQTKQLKQITEKIIQTLETTL